MKETSKTHKNLHKIYKERRQHDIQRAGSDYPVKHTVPCESHDTLAQFHACVHAHMCEHVHVLCELVI